MASVSEIFNGVNGNGNIGRTEQRERVLLWSKFIEHVNELEGER